MLISDSLDCVMCFFFFQAEDGIRDAQESRGLGDVYKRQSQTGVLSSGYNLEPSSASITISQNIFNGFANYYSLIKSKTDLKSQNLIYENKKQDCLLYTSDAADE